MEVAEDWYHVFGLGRRQIPDFDTDHMQRIYPEQVFLKF